jgi:hypothetical protein
MEKIICTLSLPFVILLIILGIIFLSDYILCCVKFKDLSSCKKLWFKYIIGQNWCMYFNLIVGSITFSWISIILPMVIYVWK